jgi:predicted anti-sigma-YlaC factor YlaD
MSRLKTAWRILNLPCREMARLASESLDRELDPLERFALRLHLLYCRACRRYASQIRLLRTALRRLATRIEADPLMPGPGLPDEVRDRIRRALKGRTKR